jgi:hypothetical protein
VTMFNESLKQVVGCWKQAFGQYAELRAAAEVASIHWAWAGGECYRPLPLYFRRFPGRARALMDRPIIVGRSIRPYILLPRIPLRASRVLYQARRVTRHASFRLREHDS